MSPKLTLPEPPSNEHYWRISPLRSVKTMGKEDPRALTVTLHDNVGYEAIDAAEEYLYYTPEATREDLISYLHLGLLFTEKGSARIVDGL